MNNQTGGIITQFNILTVSTSAVRAGQTITQVSTTGSGIGFKLTLGGANVELAATLGSGYTINLTNSSVSVVDIPGPTQSGRYLNNRDSAGTGTLYVNNILYDYEFSGAQTVTGVAPIGRGTGYAVGDELSANGGFTESSPAIVTVDSIRSIAGQTHTDFSGVSPNGSFVGGAGYSAARNTFATVDDTDNEITLDNTPHDYTCE